MSDCMPAHIAIGGQLAGADLPDLYQAILDDKARLDWDEEAMPALARFQELATDLKGEALRLFNSEAPFGELEHIEAFCQKRRLTYVRHGDAKYEFDAEMAWWAPGLPRPIVVASLNSRDVPALPLDELDAARARGSQAFEAWLAEHRPPEVPAFTVDHGRPAGCGAVHAKPV